MNRKVQTSLKSDVDKLIYLYRSKNFNAALNLSNSLLELNQDEPFLLNINGIINLSLENWQNALLTFKKILKKNDKFIEAYINLGVTYSHLGENDKAIENYKKALELNKDYASAYNNLATQYDDFGEYPIAIKNYTQALRCNPEHLNAQNNLIRILNFYKADEHEDNSIIKANNKIQEVRSNIKKFLINTILFQNIVLVVLKFKLN